MCTIERDMIRDVLVLTGTCGVGKSTLARHWAESRLGAYIDCDIFTTWIRNPALITADGFQEMLLARQAVHLARDYMALGLDVAINNVWTPDGLTYLREQLGVEANLRIVWLVCASGENHARDEQRPASDVMGGRVDELQAELDDLNWPDDVVRLDTTGQTVDATHAVIESLFGQVPGMRLNGLVLRPSTPADAGFIYDVTMATIADYANQTWDLSSAELERAVREDAAIGQDQIVLLHGRQIGVLSVEARPYERFIDKILILPDYQRWGIGSHLIRRVLDDAFDQGLTVKLHVLKVNPARRLYQRLGFIDVEESAAYYVMVARPQDSRPGEVGAMPP